MINYKVEFNLLEWVQPYPGIREKLYTEGCKKLRLVEYSSEMPPHWCEKGHYGIILEGTFQIEYSNRSETYNKGDGVFIPDGKEHKHRAQVIVGNVLALFVEEVN